VFSRLLPEKIVHALVEVPVQVKAASPANRISGAVLIQEGVELVFLEVIRILVEINRRCSLPQLNDASV